MEKIFTSPQEVDQFVLRNMDALFRYPGTTRSGKETAKETYREELSIFDLVDLKSGWRRVIRTHKSPWWPSIAILLAACRAEFLHRTLKTLGASLPSDRRRAWISAKRQLYLKAAASGFSRSSTGQAVRDAKQWIEIKPSAEDD